MKKKVAQTNWQYLCLCQVVQYDDCPTLLGVRDVEQISLIKFDAGNEEQESAISKRESLLMNRSS